MWVHDSGAPIGGSRPFQDWLAFELGAYSRPSPPENPPTMRRLISATEAVARLLGHDLFIKSDDPRCGFFDFAHKAQAWGICESWGLGMHITVGPSRRRVAA